jgi:hypothetical protein
LIRRGRFGYKGVRCHPAGAGKEEEMSGVRVLVGTRKGAFVLTADGKREKWEVSRHEPRFTHRE